jgi:hypothetical protein
MTHLVQILLPLYGNEGRPLPRELFDEVRRELTEAFGGVTAYVRAPAQGLWQDEERVVRDDVLIHEVMVDGVDRQWWADYRERLRIRFAQDVLVVRALPGELL